MCAYVELSIICSHFVYGFRRGFIRIELEMIRVSEKINFSKWCWRNQKSQNRISLISKILQLCKYIKFNDFQNRISLISFVNRDSIEFWNTLKDEWKIIYWLWGNRNYDSIVRFKGLHQKSYLDSLFQGMEEIFEQWPPVLYYIRYNILYTFMGFEEKTCNSRKMSFLWSILKTFNVVSCICVFL